MKKFIIILATLFISNFSFGEGHALLFKTIKRPNKNPELQARIQFNASGQSRIEINDDVYIDNEIYQYEIADVNYQTYYKTITTNEGVTLAEMQALLDAIVPQMIATSNASYTNIEKVLIQQYESISNQFRSDRGLKNKLEYFLNAFGELLESQIDTYRKSKSNLFNYTNDDWITLKPFSNKEYAQLDYKGDRYSALLRLNNTELSIIQHCYDVNGQKLDFKRVYPFNSLGYALVVLKSNKYVFVNSKLVVISDTYSWADPIQSGLHLVKISTRKKKRFQYIKYSGYGFEQVGNRYFDGKSFSNGFGKVKLRKRGDFKVINANLEIIKNGFDEILGFNGSYSIASVRKKRFIFKDKIKYGVIDTHGNWVLEPKYETIDDSYNFYLVYDGKTYRYLDKKTGTFLKHQGNDLLLEKAAIHHYSDDIACVKIANMRSKSVYYFLDAQGIITGLSYESCYGNIISIRGKEGLPCGKDITSLALPSIHLKIFDKIDGVRRAILFDSEYTVYYRKVKGRCNYVSVGGETNIPAKSYFLGMDFANGLAAVAQKDSIDNVLWGFIDKFGEYQIDPQYLQVLSGFENGVALVKDKKGNKIYINKYNEIIPVKY